MIPPLFVSLDLLSVVVDPSFVFLALLSEVAEVADLSGWTCLLLLSLGHLDQGSCSELAAPEVLSTVPHC